MSEKNKLKPLALAMGATFAVALTASPVIHAADNPFNMNELSNGGYMLAEGHGEGSCGEGKCGDKKEGEGKCGEGKCGEGEHGDKMEGEGKCGEGKCGDKKEGEGKCGEGKCGESGS